MMFPPPYSEFVEMKGPYGPYSDTGSNRYQMVRLIRADGTNIRVTTGKMLVEIRLGRFLEPYEAVVYLDGNPSNLNSDNLSYRAVGKKTEPPHEKWDYITGPFF